MQTLLALALVLLIACDRAPKPEPSAGLIDAGPAADVDAGASAQAASALRNAPVAPVVDAGPALEFTGTIRGVVKLAKGAKLPLAPFPQQNGVTPPVTPPCPAIDATDQRTISLSRQTGGLSPVHVALTGMTGVPPHEPVTHELFIDACRLRPGLVGAMRGDRVRVTNRTEAAFVPRVPGAKYMRGLMRDEALDGPLTQTRTNIECTFASYCGESLVIATSHPLFAVTSAEGFFTIEHVPLDQAVTVHAWHPLFSVASATPVTLTRKKPERMIELTLTPTESAVATKPGPPKYVPPPKVIERLPDGGVRNLTRGPAYD